MRLLARSMDKTHTVKAGRSVKPQRSDFGVLVRKMSVISDGMDSELRIPGGPLEYELLAILWRLGSASIAEVRTEIGHRIGTNTVATVLDRLRTKQLVTRWPQGRANIYQPLIPREIVNRAYFGAGADKVLATISGMAPAYAAEILVEALDSLDPSLLDELATTITAKKGHL
jgi:predicted transcriptional regulator